ncbi:MAG: FAD-dependent oxidoreductase [Coriobacteriaceae bacterium]|jgi:L-2-hydroxyglutarate oxidase LhgO|nr:FAD-dependent oxidoreductase [Coriobacteriaceae bacterium]
MREADGYSFDVVVVGAGVAGACAARELARFAISIAVLEAGNDIAQGASRANSGIVHAGYDPMPGTLKARFNREGSLLHRQWAQELGYPLLNNGSLVAAFSKEERDALDALAARAGANGVSEVRVIGPEELHALEPRISFQAIAALLAPSAALCDPYLVTLAAAENAAKNGVRFFFDERVEDVQGRFYEGSARMAAAASPGTGEGFSLTTSTGKRFHASVVVNAAGVYADDIHNMLSSQRLEIKPRRGEYRLYDTDLGAAFTHTVFQAPSPSGKGVLITPTVHGNLLVGPNAVAQTSKTDVSTTAEGLEFVLKTAQKTWPDLPSRGMIANFAGLRASSATDDFVLGEPPDAPGLFDIAAFDSPGLSSAPAVAAWIAQQAALRLGARPNPHFDPIRKAPVLFAQMDDEDRAEAIAADPRHGHLVCRCCKVTEADLVGLLRGPLPVLSLDTLKWRSRATMGRCHGGFCSPEIIKIIAREARVVPSQLDKRLHPSPVVVGNRPDYLGLCDDVGEAAPLCPDEGEAMLTDACEATEAPPCARAREAAESGTDFKPDAAPDAKPDAAPDAKPDARIKHDPYDVVVIGGGAAGLAAAATAAAQVPRVLLIERDQGLGGILRQCIHNGFGLHRFSEELTGPEYAWRDVEAARKQGASLMTGSSVLAIKPASGTQPFHAAIVANGSGEHLIPAKAVVIATGSRERGLGALNMAGTRPAGVFSAGSAQNLMNLQGCIPGNKAVILGSGDIGLIMARRMAMAGMKVAGVYEMLPQPSGLRRNIVQCLDDYGIPLYLSRTVVRLEGEGRLSAVSVAKVDSRTLEVVPGTEERIECDTLLLSVGLIPENELAHDAGIMLDGTTGGAQVDNHLATSCPGVFACGNALHIHDLADHASREGEIAGTAAAAYARDVSGTAAAAYARDADGTATPQACVDGTATAQASAGETIPQQTEEDERVLPQAVEGGRISPQAVEGGQLLPQAGERGQIPVRAAEGVRYVVPQRIDPLTAHDETIALSFRVTTTLTNPRFTLEGRTPEGELVVIKTSRTGIAVPAEMIQVNVMPEQLEGIHELWVRALDLPVKPPSAPSIPSGALHVDDAHTPLQPLEYRPSPSLEGGGAD